MRNYFSKKEQACNCCGVGEFQLSFLNRLNSARELAGIPFHINSGVRCPAHNKRCNGAETSSHLTGWACDIECEDSRTRSIILRALLSVGFNRMGIADSFIHVDCDPIKVGNVTWVY